MGVKKCKHGWCQITTDRQGNLKEDHPTEHYAVKRARSMGRDCVQVCKNTAGERMPTWLQMV